MDIKVLGLYLSNFKGVTKFDLETDTGQSVTVRGPTGSGKTSLKDAFMYLFTGKNSKGEASFGIKTTDEDNEEIHHLDHSVECELSIDGVSKVFKKVYKENWPTKRGASAAMFSGHSVDYSIDDVPIQEKGFDIEFGKIIDKNTFRLLTDHAYFISKNFQIPTPGKKGKKAAWEDRRHLILDIVGGDVDDGDVIDSNPDLATLSDILGNRSLDEHRAVVSARKPKIKERQKEIPVSIKEINGLIADASEYDPIEIGQKIKEFEAKLQTAKDDQSCATLRKQKIELDIKLTEAKAEVIKARKNATKDVEDLIDSLENDLKKPTRELEDTKGARRLGESEIKRVTERMDILRLEFNEISSQKFSGDTNCPACGQDLPEDQVQEAVKQHNMTKAQLLAGNNEVGKSLKEESKALKERIDELTIEQGNLEKVIEGLNQKLVDALQLEGDISSQVSPEEAKHQKTVDTLQSEINTISAMIEENKPPDTFGLESTLKVERQKLSEIDASQRSMARIDELDEEEKKLAEEFERLEHETYLMDQFTVSRVNLLEDKIASKFAVTRFKMFNRLVNGGIEETCIPILNGSSNLSTGEEMIVGLDCIKTFQQHYGIKAPAWLDDCVLLTSEQEIDCQVISLVADKACSELVVEYE